MVVRVRLAHMSSALYSYSKNQRKKKLTSARTNTFTNQLVKAWNARMACEALAMMENDERPATNTMVATAAEQQIQYNNKIIITKATTYKQNKC